MTDQPIIWVTNEYSQFCALGDWARTAHSPAGWLDAAFTFQWATGAFLNEELVSGPECIRPMIELIDQDEDADEDDYGPMVTGHTDYDDSGRWWL